MDQESTQNGPYFKTSEAISAVWRSLGNISEEEKIEIIKLGFQLNQEGKISLKKYYEGVSEVNSLFQLRGYRIKYETI